MKKLFLLFLLITLNVQLNASFWHSFYSLPQKYCAAAVALVRRGMTAVLPFSQQTAYENAQSSKATLQRNIANNTINEPPSYLHPKKIAEVPYGFFFSKNKFVVEHHTYWCDHKVDSDTFKMDKMHCIIIRDLPRNEYVEYTYIQQQPPKKDFWYRNPFPNFFKAICDISIK